jgi:hypothetical protein
MNKTPLSNTAKVIYYVFILPMILLFYNLLVLVRNAVTWHIAACSYRVDKPFKAQWELYVPPALTISNCAFCIYGSCMIFNVNSDYFLEQHKPADLCNGEELCFLCGTDWILKYYLDELWLQRGTRVIIWHSWAKSAALITIYDVSPNGGRFVLKSRIAHRNDRHISTWLNLRILVNLRIIYTHFRSL